MRLYPPAWGLGRDSYADDEIGGFRILGKSSVFVSPWLAHRDRRFWEEPERFDPDRFSPERSKGRQEKGCRGDHCHDRDGVHPRIRSAEQQGHADGGRVDHQAGKGTRRRLRTSIRGVDGDGRGGDEHRHRRRVGICERPSDHGDREGRGTDRADEVVWPAQIVVVDRRPSGNELHGASSNSVIGGKCAVLKAYVDRCASISSTADAGTRRSPLPIPIR